MTIISLIKQQQQQQQKPINPKERDGGGLYLIGFNRTQVSYNTINNNIAARHGITHISYTRIENNEAGGNGGGMNIFHLDFTMSLCNIIANKVMGQGGGLWLHLIIKVQLSYSTVNQNSAVGNIQ